MENKSPNSNCSKQTDQIKNENSLSSSLFPTSLAQMLKVQNNALASKPKM
jgi:hypothetical protein